MVNPQKKSEPLAAKYSEDSKQLIATCHEGVLRVETGNAMGETQRLGLGVLCNLLPEGRELGMWLSLKNLGCYGWVLRTRGGEGGKPGCSRWGGRR